MVEMTITIGNPLTTQVEESGLNFHHDIQPTNFDNFIIDLELVDDINYF